MVCIVTMICRLAWCNEPPYAHKPMITNIPPLLQPGAALRHYRGGRYTLVGACVIEDTLEAGILYRPCQGDSGDTVWMRPTSAFDEIVDVPDGAKRRVEVIFCWR
jgi:hypothetical protein